MNQTETYHVGLSAVKDLILSFLGLVVGVDDDTKKLYKYILIDFYESTISAFEAWHIHQNDDVDPLVKLLTTYRRYMFPRARMLYLIGRDTATLYRLIAKYKKIPIVK